MHELLNTRTNKIISFPQDVDELTPDQYLFYLDLVLQQMVGEISDPQAIKRKLFAYFTDLKLGWKMGTYSEEVIESIWSSLSDKIDLLDSFFDIEETDGKVMYSMHVKCGMNLLPAWNKHKGPEDMLSDITWGQFKICLNALKMISIAQEEDDVEGIERNTMDMFNAMYKNPQPLKGGKKYKNREIPDTVLYHAQTYFSYVYELITTVPIPINGEEMDFSILWKKEEGDDEDSGDKSGWLGITFGIAESGVFGDFKNVDEENMYNVLIYLYKQAVTARHERKKRPLTPKGE